MYKKLFTLTLAAAALWNYLSTMSEADARDYICDSAQEFRALGPAGVRPPTEHWINSTQEHLTAEKQDVYALCLDLIERCETPDHQGAAIQVCVRGQFQDRDRTCEEARLLFEESPVPCNKQLRRPAPAPAE